MRWTTAISAFAVISVLTGCAATTSQLQETSASRTGCQPTEIRISRYKLGVNTSSWTATCGGKMYYCAGTDMLQGVSCAAMPGAQ